MLREYYEGASLIQTAQKTRSTTDEQGDGSGILGMLEVANSRSGFPETITVVFL